MLLSMKRKYEPLYYYPFISTICIIISGSPYDMLHLYHIIAASCYRILRNYENIMTITTQPLLHYILTHKITLDLMRDDISSMQQKWEKQHMKTSEKEDQSTGLFSNQDKIHHVDLKTLIIWLVVSSKLTLNVQILQEIMLQINFRTQNVTFKRNDPYSQ